MKTWGKEDHDVGLLAASIFDLLVGDFVKGQGSHPLPDFKRPPDGFVWVILSNLGSVVLDTMGRKSRGKGEAYFSHQFKVKPIPFDLWATKKWKTCKPSEFKSKLEHIVFYIRHQKWKKSTSKKIIQLVTHKWMFLNQIWKTCHLNMIRKNLN